jgi:D-sedoheptulose 7-phosphate isomerase
MKNLDSFVIYANQLSEALAKADWSPVGELGNSLLDCWTKRRQVFICGNGGSAGNAIHLANDFLYGIGKGKIPGLRVHALPANSAVLTCLANDIGYQEVFSEQLRALGDSGDVLIALSGSGNSPNILAAISAAKEMGMSTFGILGYSGGKAKAIVDVPIHFAVNDMQIAEDLQLVVGHMLMQRLCANV